MTSMTVQTRLTISEKLRAALPWFLTVFLFMMGAWAVWRLLVQVDFRTVSAQIHATPLHVILLAVGMVIVGYAALVGYDWSALRYLKKRLPLPVIMAGGFIGYALGNTVGAGPVTGGAVRYRIYSSLGLTGQDIATIAIFGSIAFGLGATFLGFGALALHPRALGALAPVSPQILRWICIAALVALVSFSVWLTRRKKGFTVHGVRLDAPSGSLMAGQLAFTLIEMVAAATVLYILMPAGAPGFPTFLAVFVAASFAGVVSHVPGGVGVFETIMIAALPSSIPLEHATAALLLYRMIYYFLPFAVALVLLALSELHMGSKHFQITALKPIAPVFGAVGAVVPLAMGAMILGSGLIMVFSFAISAGGDFAEDVEIILPLGFVHGGAVVSVAVGFGLLIIAQGLLRRSRLAFALAVFSLMTGIIAALIHEPDIDRIVSMGLILLILFPTRREFNRGMALSWPVPARILMLAGLFGGAVMALIASSRYAASFSQSPWWQASLSAAVPMSVKLLMTGSACLALWALWLLLRPGKVDTSLASPGEIAWAERIIAAQGRADAGFALTGDKSLMFSREGDAFIMFRAQGRSWIALGDPVGAEDQIPELAWSFAEAARAAYARPVFYEATDRYQALWSQMGFASHKMGEEAIIPLDHFSLEGSHRKKLRAARSRAERDGLRFGMVEAPLSDQAFSELKEVSDQWLAEKGGREKSFSVGRFAPDYLRMTPIAIIRHEGRVVAFANILAAANREEAGTDLMRHVSGMPAGAMDFLFIELMLHLKAEGYRQFSLGMAPLAGLDAIERPDWISRLGILIYRNGRSFYSFEGLRNFKAKFDPEWRSRFLVSVPHANLLAVGLDATNLISGGLRAQPGKAGPERA